MTTLYIHENCDLNDFKQALEELSQMGGKSIDQILEALKIDELLFPPFFKEDLANVKSRYPIQFGPLDPDRVQTMVSHPTPLAILEDGDKIYALSCNLDDMSGEEIGYAIEKLWQHGALDVFTQAIQMKKQRPGTLLTVLTRAENKGELLRTMFKHTTTLGIRQTPCDRYILKRTVTTVTTPLGNVRKKCASGYGVKRYKYEYDDLAQIANEVGISIKEAEAYTRKFDEEA